MTADNFLPKALFFSLLAHTIFVVGTFIIDYNKIEPKKRAVKGVEITYQPKKKQVDVAQRPIQPIQQLDLRSDAQNSQSNIPVKLVKDSQSSVPFSMYERKPEKVKTLEVKRTVSIMPIKSEKINNPAYASYNEMIRTRIKEKVEENYNQLEVGHVYLAFVVDAAGNVKAAQIVQEKTDASLALQQLSLQSLRDASPFPAFFKGMTLPEYPLNIEIQYQVHE